MSNQEWTKEPWVEIFLPESIISLSKTDYARAKACVNALANIPDPAAFVEQARRMREALESVIELAEAYVADYHASMCGYRQFQHDAMDADIAKARAALRSQP